jgi:hypothetical protein
VVGQTIRRVRTAVAPVDFTWKEQDREDLPAIWRKSIDKEEILASEVPGL